MSRKLILAALNCFTFCLMVGCSLIEKTPSDTPFSDQVDNEMDSEPNTYMTLIKKIDANKDNKTSDVSDVDENSEVNEASKELRIVTERYKSGTYTGEAMGRNGMIKATVTITEDGIEDIAIAHNETETVISGQDEQFLSMIIQTNKVNVDNISGATITSEAIKEAVAIALTEAR